MIKIESNYTCKNGHIDAKYVLSRTLLFLLQITWSLHHWHVTINVLKTKNISDFSLLYAKIYLLFPHAFASRVLFSLDIKCWFSTLGSIMCLLDGFINQSTSALAFRSMPSVKGRNDLCTLRFSIGWNRVKAFCYVTLSFSRSTSSSRVTSSKPETLLTNHIITFWMFHSERPAIDITLLEAWRSVHDILRADE